MSHDARPTDERRPASAPRESAASPQPPRPSRRRQPSARRRSAGNRRVARRLCGRAGCRRSGARTLPARPVGTTRASALRRLGAAARHALRQQHSGRTAAGVSGRSGHRGTPGVDHALERAGDGGARQRGARRTRWPHRQLCQRGRPVRGRLQPFLPRAHRIIGRRPDLLPAALGAGRVRAGLSRRPARRSLAVALPPGDHGAAQRRARPVELPAPLADA